MSEVETVEERLRRVGGAASGFDYLRIGLASAVICWHSLHVSYGWGAADYFSGGIYRPLVAGILPIFFALSGFLVAGSLERSKMLLDFLLLRAIRLVPALAVEVALSALLLGPLLTKASLAEYFSAPDFYLYFGNIVGSIRMRLPGVFIDNPIAGVTNLSLWTVPYELESYLALAAVSMVGLLTRPALNAAIFLAALVFLTAHDFSHGALVDYGPLPGRALVACFMAGVLVWRRRAKITLRASAAVCAGLLTIGAIYIPELNYFASIPAAYLTVYLGLMNPRKIWLVRAGDYSYGMYLFAYPIQQTIAAAFVHAGAPQSWPVNFALAWWAALGYAMFSWHFVEHPCLSRRKALLAFVGRRLTAARGRPAQADR